jgi:phosphoserine aminotransferase
VSNRIFNFSSGPAVLPEPVLRRAQAALWELDGTGIGILEHSHRGEAFGAVLDRAERLVRSLLGVPDDYAVLFMQGGASAQFHLVPMNLLPADGTADYCETGTWSAKALSEARRFGHVHVACSSAADQYATLPTELRWSARPAYVHTTSNETIVGVQWPAEPPVPAGVPLVCDASSDLFSRPLDVSRYGLIYAGAQKNLGPSGVTLVIARRDLVAAPVRDLPPLLRYQAFVDERSMPNTPPTFGIYVIAETLAWLAEQGGLEAIAARNARKAGQLYEALDASDRFIGHAAPGSRSLMNVTFRTDDPALDRAFLAEAAAGGLSGLAGHRSFGGMRASLYNAFPEEGVHALVALIRDFDRRHRR